MPSATYALPLSPEAPHAPAQFEQHLHKHSSSEPNAAFANTSNAYASPRPHGSGHQYSLSQAQAYPDGQRGSLLSSAKTNLLNVGSDLMRKPRPRGESDLGRPSSFLRTNSSHASFSPLPTIPASPRMQVEEDVKSYKPSTRSELTTAILLPLPYLLLSLAVQSSSSLPSSATHTDQVPEGPALPNLNSSPKLAPAFFLTSGTLLIAGFAARLSRGSTVLDVGKKELESPGSLLEAPKLLVSLSTWRSMASRALSVSLPFLATFELGGARVGVMLLAAAASGILTGRAPDDGQTSKQSWKKIISERKTLCVFYVLSLLFDALTASSTGKEIPSILRGYVMLIKATLFLPLPLLASPSAFSASGAYHSRSYSSSNSSRRLATAPLVASPYDTNLTILAGAVLGLLTLSFNSFSITALLDGIPSLGLFCSIITAWASLSLSVPSTLSSTTKVGFALGTLLCAGLGFLNPAHGQGAYLVDIVVPALMYGGLWMHNRNPFGSLKKHHRGHNYDHKPHTHHHHDHPPKSASLLTKWLLKHTTDQPLLHSVLVEKESRRIVYFMFVNFAFMFVQTFYALVAGSLGLLSDSIHMFFDCIGLLAGLVAAVMSKWPPNARFPYGYGKVETLSGLGNGIFLMIISVEIIWESFERFMEGAELKRLNELMLVSVGGLLVNLIGLKFIGHDHAHHGHDHGHDHDHENENMMGIYLHILADTMGSVAVIASTILTVYTGWSGWDPIASCVIALLIIAASFPLVASSARRLLLTIPSDVEYLLRSTLQDINGIPGVAGYAVPRFWLDDSEDSQKEKGHDHHHHHHHDHDHHDAHDHNHNHNHNHGHGHDHDHSHEHGSHEHKHDHSHDHQHGDHSHSHDHSPDHTHDNHSHGSPSSPVPPPPNKKILGVIHVIAQQGADVEDVRARVEAFLQERNMNIVLHVEKSGVGRCWCGGLGGSRHGRMRSTVAMM